MPPPQVTALCKKKQTVAFGMTKARPAFVRAAWERYGTVEKEPRTPSCWI